MLQKEQLETLLTRAMASSADFAEIFEEDTQTESFSMLNGKVENVDTNYRAGLGVRLYQGVQSVYGYTNDTNIRAIERLIDDLRESFERKDTGVQVRLTETVVENRHPVEINPFQVKLESKVDLLKRANQACIDYDSRIFKRQIGLSNIQQHVQISNSEGRFVKDTRIRTRMVVQAFAQQGDQMQSGHEAPGASAGLEFYAKQTPESIAKEACRVALVLLKAKDCPSGKMPVIIDNGFGGVIFHEACGHALEATAVAKQQSVFSNMEGKQIANEKVTAIDDGTIPNAWGSQNVDDEGSLQQKRTLIQNGKLTSYMIDRLNGRRMGKESTGSSRRQSYKFEPTSRMSNTFIAAGEDDFDEMFVGIQKGLYAKKMGGGSVNPQTGEFNFAVNEGYMIEDGKITYPVKGASLIGTGAEILMHIDRVGKDLKRAQGMCGSISGNIPTDVGQPPIRVSSITVGGTSHE